MHADLHHVDDEVGTLERGAAIGVLGDRRGGAEVRGDQRAIMPAVSSRSRIDVVQRDGAVVHLWQAEEIGQQVAFTNTTLPAPIMAILGTSSVLSMRLLQAGAGDTLNQQPLEYQEDQQHRNERQQRKRHHVRPFRIDLAAQQVEAER